MGSEEGERLTSSEEVTVESFRNHLVELSSSLTNAVLEDLPVSNESSAVADLDRARSISKRITEQVAFTTKKFETLVDANLCAKKSIIFERNGGSMKFEADGNIIGNSIAFASSCPFGVTSATMVANYKALFDDALSTSSATRFASAISVCQILVLNYESNEEDDLALAPDAAKMDCELGDLVTNFNFSKVFTECSADSFIDGLSDGLDFSNVNCYIDRENCVSRAYRTLCQFFSYIPLLRFLS